MTTNAPPQASRRHLLKGLGAGLMIATWLPGLARPQSGAAAAPAQPSSDPTVFAPNAFIRIAPDDTVTVLIKHIEFGQGPFTGLATLVAEELDADWSQMRAEHAPSDVAAYANLLFGVQGTGGSTAMANSYIQMRKAGAAARAMLVEAAAEAWDVPVEEITVQAGQVRHAPSGKTSGFGALADRAAQQTAPEEPVLKDPSQFVLIGTDRPKLDTVAKTDGSAQFTLDLIRDDMLTVAVRHPPRFGGKPASVDATATLAIPGVVTVHTLSSGVAVYAENTYAAFTGRDALSVTWDDSAAETRSSEELFAAYNQAVARPGLPATVRGDAEGTLAADGVRTLETVYEFPYLAHAPMEPLDAVLARRGDRVDAWLGSQLPTVDQNVIAGNLGLDPAQVLVHTMLAGGSFGRRAQPDSGFAAEAAGALRALGGDATIKLVWSREDDLRGGRYRPLTVHRLRGAIDASGTITAWDQTIATQSILAGSPFDMMIQDGIDSTSVEGARDLPYAIPNFRVTVHNMQAGVPVLWWRSVGHTHTAHATEAFLDELFALVGTDPVAGRRALLGDAHPRHRAVLERVAEIADWGGPVPNGRARGIALHKSFNSYVAEIAEVSEGPDGEPKVHKVWCAIDCGVPVNPNIIRAQIEGGVGYGLGHALYAELTLEDGGTVAQGNFDTYRSLRITEMPAIEVAIVDSREAPTGVGEPGTPPIVPAVANAWRTLTGRSVRRLPFLNNVARNA